MLGYVDSISRLQIQHDGKKPCASKKIILVVRHQLTISTFIKVVPFLKSEHKYSDINNTLGRALDPRANGTWLSKLTGSSYLRRTDN